MNAEPVWVHNGDYENLPDKGTHEGDAARYERYTAGGGDMEYDDWYCHSRGGRNGGEAQSGNTRAIRKPGGL